MNHSITVSQFVLAPDQFGEAFRPVASLMHVVENNDWHIQQSVLDHTMRVATSVTGVIDFAIPELATFVDQKERVQRYTERRVGGSYSCADLLRLAALFHDIGKEDTL